MTLNQGSPNFLVRGSHKLLLNSPRAGYLTYVIVSGNVTFYQIDRFFSVILFFLIGKNVFVGRIWPAGRSLETSALNDVTLYMPVHLFVQNKPAIVIDESIAIPLRIFSCTQDICLVSKLRPEVSEKTPGGVSWLETDVSFSACCVPHAGNLCRSWQCGSVLGKETIPFAWGWYRGVHGVDAATAVLYGLWMSLIPCQTACDRPFRFTTARFFHVGCWNCGKLLCVTSLGFFTNADHGEPLWN